MRNIQQMYNNTIDALITGLQKIKIAPRTKCQARCHINNRQCNKLSPYKYCPNHYEIRKEFHRLYHLYDHRLHYLDNMKLEDIIECELSLRAKYKIMFHLDWHLGHQLWENFLRFEAQRGTLTPELCQTYNTHEIIEWYQKAHMDIEIKFERSRSIYCPFERYSQSTWPPTATQMLGQYFEDYIWSTYAKYTHTIDALDLQIDANKIQNTYFLIDSPNKNPQLS